MGLQTYLLFDFLLVWCVSVEGTIYAFKNQDDLCLCNRGTFFDTDQGLIQGLIDIFRSDYWFEKYLFLKDILHQIYMGSIFNPSSSHLDYLLPVPQVSSDLGYLGDSLMTPELLPFLDSLLKTADPNVEAIPEDKFSLDRHSPSNLASVPSEIPIQDSRNWDAEETPQIDRKFLYQPASFNGSPSLHNDEDYHLRTGALEGIQDEENLAPRQGQEIISRAHEKHDKDKASAFAAAQAYDGRNLLFGTPEGQAQISKYYANGVPDLSSISGLLKGGVAKSFKYGHKSTTRTVYTNTNGNNIYNAGNLKWETDEPKNYFQRSNIADGETFKVPPLIHSGRTWNYADGSNYPFQESEIVTSQPIENKWDGLNARKSEMVSPEQPEAAQNTSEKGKPKTVIVKKVIRRRPRRA